MMLRESSKFSAEAVDLRDVTEGLSAGTEVANAPLLVDFAEAVVARDEPRTRAARAALRQTMGDAAFVDIAAVVAAFHGFVRIADAIGIPYTTAAMGQDAPDIREATGVNRFYRISGEGAMPM
jgi:dienelactone hydrolase